jgi:hypothetical protein
MEGALTAVIAVIGTLLGSVVTYQFQRRSSEHAERASFQQQLRSERMTIYSGFAGSITEFRRSEHDWWHRKDEDNNSRACFDARAEAYHLRGVALHALVRIQLVTACEVLLDGARHTYELTAEIHHAPTETDLSARGAESRDSLEKFITLASRDIQRDPTSPLSPPWPTALHS